jgi:hypothetical protein
MIIIALFWAAFWFFDPLGGIIAKKGGAGFSQSKTVFYLLVFIVIIALILRRVKVSRLVANTIAVLLCLMFAFNFFPGAVAASRSGMQRAYNKKTGKLPYKIKTEFNVDQNLPKPNIYWFHMDGMVGFDSVERYFNDSQITLKNDLTERGFVINKSARLEAGTTMLALPAMLSPVFYDSYLAGEFAGVAQLTRVPRTNSISMSMAKKGFSLSDIYPQIEILKALSDAGYINIGSIFAESKNLDRLLMIHLAAVTVGELSIYREVNSTFDKASNFIGLITLSSALSIIKPKIDNMLEKRKPVLYTQQFPLYQETVDKYLTGSDNDHYMAFFIRGIKYVASMQTPHFVYYFNHTTHFQAPGTEIGGVIYDSPIGNAFIWDENGNFYKERLDDPNDVRLYLPQHKYAVKQMMAQVDTLIENDPNAVIVIQADHGIHGIGTHVNGYDSKFMFKRGYSLEDQLNLNLNVISAVRIPPQYGELSQPLDPLDISRYLINNFVGKGNYDYLYYTGE